VSSYITNGRRLKKKNKQKTTITLGFSRWQMKSKSQIERSKCKKPTAQTKATKFSKLRTVCQWGISRPADPPDAWIPPLHRFEMRLFGWLAA